MPLVMEAIVNLYPPYFHMERVDEHLGVACEHELASRISKATIQPDGIYFIS
jgi:hypothetical protein